MHTVAAADPGHLEATAQAQTRVLRGTAWPVAMPATHRMPDRYLLEMDRVYARSGGMATGDEVAQRLRCWSEQPLSTVARWIVNRRIVSFEWEGQTLVPLFQFNLEDMTIRAGVTSVLNELNDVLDVWELAIWFAQPNTWLNEECPADAIHSRPNAVLHAARSDRFVALG